MAAVPNWRDVYRGLVADIRNATLPAGAQLPSQSQLCRQYGASRHAVRRALAALEQDGEISCWQGREAVVVGRPILYQINRRTRFASGLRALGHEVKVSALRSSEAMRLSVRVAGLLQLKPQDRAPFAEFMHHVDGLPTALGRHFFNAARCPDILHEVIKPEPSVPEAFLRSGVKDYYRSATLVEVRQPTAYEATTLDIPPSQTVLCLWGQNVDEAGAPLEVTEAVVRTDKVQLQIGTHQVTDLA